MTSKEDIIRMARETGIADAFLVTPHPGVVQQLERFAELVRADERESCAKVCESLWHIDGQFTANEFAAEVRARGQA